MWQGFRKNTMRESKSGAQWKLSKHLCAVTLATVCRSLCGLGGIWPLAENEMTFDSSKTGTWSRKRMLPFEHFSSIVWMDCKGIFNSNDRTPFWGAPRSWLVLTMPLPDYKKSASKINKKLWIDFYHLHPQRGVEWWQVWCTQAWWAVRQTELHSRRALVWNSLRWCHRRGCCGYPGILQLVPRALLVQAEKRSNPAARGAAAQVEWCRSPSRDWLWRSSLGDFGHRWTLLAVHSLMWVNT